MAIGSERPTQSLDELRASAADCRACDLWERATQTVFGEGAATARVMLVGEQPGDQEDRAGAPFVGPAGKLLDRALDEAGIDRRSIYVTNAVKHFKWRPSGSGKRRIHDKPSWTQIGACLPWLESELAVVRPELVVCLGATAAQALLGRDFRVTKNRGRVLESPLAPRVVATVHPSSILRAQGEAARAEQLADFIADLRAAASALDGQPRRTARPRASTRQPSGRGASQRPAPRARRAR
jgi:uracil-DNA glycosylase family protein